ncbi:MAG: hypothetical protein ACYCZK_08450 [Microbacteriaceae bacterium]
MNLSRPRAIVVIASIALVGIGLTGCSAPATSTGDSPAAAQPMEAAKPADLARDWKQSNSQSSDSYQEATITADTIEINWVSDGGDTTSLYWAGTYTPPTKAGSFTWTSTNDTSKTDGALLASGDATKDFSFDGSQISYKVSALGTTTTVKLERK